MMRILMLGSLLMSGVFGQSSTFNSLTALRQVREAKTTLQPGKDAPDNWEKMKDCATQAEKLMERRNRQNAALGIGAASDWTNHYSPKYNRCFVVASYFVKQEGWFKHESILTTSLLDAFEGAFLAASANIAVPPDFACRQDNNPHECEQGIRDTVRNICKVGDQVIDCPKAEEFIKEHMKN